MDRGETTVVTENHTMKAFLTSSPKLTRQPIVLALLKLSFEKLELCMPKSKSTTSRGGMYVYVLDDGLASYSLSSTFPSKDMGFKLVPTVSRRHSVGSPVLLFCDQGSENVIEGAQRSSMTDQKSSPISLDPSKTKRFELVPMVSRRHSVCSPVMLMYDQDSDDEPQEYQKSTSHDEKCLKSHACDPSDDLVDLRTLASFLMPPKIIAEKHADLNIRMRHRRQSCCF